MDYDQYLNAVQQQINANNSWSASQAEKQMQFQERLSNTAHQREIADLQAAGLNPVLSANSGASTPNGAMANGDSNAVQALVSMMNKFLDIEANNAKAQLVSARTGYLNTSTSAAGNNNILSDFLMALGMNKSQANGINNVVQYVIGDKTIGDFIEQGSQALSHITTSVLNSNKNNSNNSSKPWIFDTDGNEVTSSGITKSQKKLTTQILKEAVKQSTSRSNGADGVRGVAVKQNANKRSTR